mgnify:CR=1 FL=1
MDAGNKASGPLQHLRVAQLRRAATVTSQARRSRTPVRSAAEARSLCDEAGQPVLTAKEAEDIPGTVKQELCALIAAGSKLATDAFNTWLNEQ